jgi:hypothetical protein
MWMWQIRFINVAKAEYSCLFGRGLGRAAQTTNSTLVSSFFLLDHLLHHGQRHKGKSRVSWTRSTVAFTCQACNSRTQNIPPSYYRCPCEPCVSIAASYLALQLHFRNLVRLRLANCAEAARRPTASKNWKTFRLLWWARGVFGGRDTGKSQAVQNLVAFQ